MRVLKETKDVIEACFIYGKLYNDAKVMSSSAYRYEHVRVSLEGIENPQGNVNALETNVRSDTDANKR